MESLLKGVWMFADLVCQIRRSASTGPTGARSHWGTARITRYSTADGAEHAESAPRDQTLHSDSPGRTPRASETRRAAESRSRGEAGARLGTARVRQNDGGDWKRGCTDADCADILPPGSPEVLGRRG